MTNIRNATGGSSDATQLLYGRSSQSSASGVSANAAAVLQTAQKRISGEVSRNTTLLSTLGKLKSSIADTQSAAQVLAGFSATTTAEQMKNGIARLVDTFNATVGASKNISATSGGAERVPAATRAGQDMKRAIHTNADLGDALRKWGVSVQGDGEVTFDATKFDARLKTDPEGASVFQRLGQVIDKVTTKALATDGVVGRSMSALNKRGDTLKLQQASLLDALKAGTPSTTEATAKENAAESLKTQRNSLFDFLQDDSSSETETSIAARNSALAAYRSVAKGG